MHLTTIDFETDKIENRPHYPPEPVGVAIEYPNGKNIYLAWGHPCENNTTKVQAIKRLKQEWHKPLLFHNAAFDIEVAVERLGLPVPRLWDDTLLLAFLHDPRDVSLSLKPMAAKYLNMPPDEQTELKKWIITNVPEAKKKPSTWGAYIAKAPGRLVGKYAIGDVHRTAALYRYMYPKISEANMLKAYQREREVIYVKLDMEQPGLRISPRLKKDYPKWKKASDGIEQKIKRRLKVSKDFNINSGPQLADVLVKRGKLDRIVKTPTGKVSTKRIVLEENCNDKHLVQLLGINGVLGTYIGTFIEPWILSSEVNAGQVYPTFNTVRSTDEYGRGGFGARTGRLSSSNPNFQNIPTDVEESQHEELLRSLQKYLLDYDIRFIGLRDYIVPQVGCVFIRRDYSQQELRILGHYEDGELIERFRDPKFDIHTFIQKFIHHSTGILYPRKHIKITVFGLMYGMGAGKLSVRLKMSYQDAQRLKNNVLDALPGISWLNKELKMLSKAKKPLYTWGGRRYFAEEPKWIKSDGEWTKKNLDYKMLNVLIQGSAADATKQAMIQVNHNCASDHFHMLVQVHDELLAEVPKGQAEKQMKKMKEAMEDLKFDVNMTTDGYMGYQSWAKMKKVN